MNEQGSPGWIAERLGKCTASRFKDVLTKPRSGDGLSKTARSYELDLIAERLTLEPQGFGGNAATDWGNEHEADAIALYQEVAQVKVERCGFWEKIGAPGVGCSPDGLVGHLGGVEVKCPYNPRVHLEYLLGGVCPKGHVAQVQGNMWCRDADWWDFCSYDPRINPDLGKNAYKLALFRVRVLRDEKYIDTLAYRVASFLDVLRADLHKLTQGMNR